MSASWLLNSIQYLLVFLVLADLISLPKSYIRHTSSSSLITFAILQDRQNVSSAILVFLLQFEHLEAETLPAISPHSPTLTYKTYLQNFAHLKQQLVQCTPDKLLTATRGWSRMLPVLVSFQMSAETGKQWRFHQTEHFKSIVNSRLAQKHRRSCRVYQRLES